MKIKIIKVFSVVTALLCSISVHAQKLPALPSDPAVKKGALPNGLTYFIAVNPSAAGHADFALVQKIGTSTVNDTLAERTVDLAKDALAELPRIKGPSPQVWLARHGVTTSREGFVNVSSDATVFRFPDVSLTSGKNVADSTLLLLLTIVDRVSTSDDAFMKKWYSPSDQAIVIAGDVNANDLIAKMTSMSYMIPAKPASPKKKYKWQDCDSAVFHVSSDSRMKLAEVSLAWRLPRAPVEYMNTVQPAIYERFVNVLGYLAERRIRQDLERRNVPVAGLSYSHRSSASGSGDERFTVNVSVPAEFAETAVGAIGRTFGSLDAAAVELDEYVIARNHYLHELEGAASESFKRNSDYVDRCISAFLYNASLASSKEKLDFHKSRQLSDSTQFRLFQDMTKALVDDSRNLIFSCITPDKKMTEEKVRNRLYASWSDSYHNPSSLDAFYTEVPFEWQNDASKVKLKDVTTDPMSKGTLMVFSNGFRVLHKKMTTSGKIWWTMALNGGYGSIEDLSEGEGAYVSDYMGLCKIGGMEGRAFRDMLMSGNMTMETRVGLTATLFSGEAPKDSLDKVLQLLLAVSNDRVPDKEAYARYMKEEDLRLSMNRTGRAARMAVLDSIMCPGYKYSWMKTPGKLTPELSAKADSFFERQASKMNDGVLVLISEMDEEVLKKKLLNYVGDFRTDGTAFRRPPLRYQPVSGWSTYTVEGEENSIDVVMSAAMNMTMDSYMTAALAAMVLKNSISAALVNTGMYADVAYNFQIFPQERLSMAISVSQLDKDGYASSIEPSGAIDALDILRAKLKELSGTKVSKTELAACKAYLKSYLGKKMTAPSYWTDAVAKRFLDGKDFTTSYAAAVDAVTDEKLMRVFAELNGGSKVEYIVQK